MIEDFHSQYIESKSNDKLYKQKNMKLSIYVIQSIPAK